MTTKILEHLKDNNVAAARELVAECANDAGLASAVDSEGFSVLHWAALRGFAELVLLLLQQGVDPNIRGPNEHTPLMWAAMNQELLVMHILVDHGASIRATDNISDNALLMACQHDKFFAALWLLGRGAEVNTTNIAGSSGAHWAAFSGSYLVICLLDAYGLKMRSVYDRNGLLPLHRALELEFWGTARMMVTFEPALLTETTRDGLNLTKFADSRSLPQQTFENWWKLCLDASYKTPTTDDCSRGGGVDLGDTARYRGLQGRLWNYLVGLLDYLEKSPKRRKLIPCLTYGFAVAFVSAHNLGLGRVNRFIAEHLGFTAFERAVLRRVLLAIPYLAFVAITAFTCLFVINPGFSEQNFVSRVKNTGLEEPPSDPKSSDFTMAQLLKMKGELRRSGEQSVDLQDPNGTEAKVRLLRSRRREMFDEMFRYVNSPEALLMITATPLTAQDSLTRQYLESKGIQSESSPAARSRLREKLDLTRICPTCWVRRGLRTKHCSSCDRCCDLMDHHCVWVNSCIGKNSHACFALFIFTGYVAQVHQIALVLLSAVFAISSPWQPHLPGPRGVAQVAGVVVASLLHFITITWSSELLKAQWKNMAEGYTVNESLNEVRYKHFIVAAHCDKTGLPDRSFLEDDEQGSLKHQVTEGGSGAQPLAIKFKKEGAELFEQPPALPKKEELVRGVVEQPPQIVDAAQEESAVLLVRRFVRNPFAAPYAAIENVIQFWTNSRPTEILYEHLNDDDFIRSVSANIQQRRAARLF